MDGRIVSGHLVVDPESIIKASPTKFEIRLSPEARGRLLSTGLMNLEGRDDEAWSDIEEALTEVMLGTFTHCYITGVIPDHDRCPLCGVNSRRAGSAACTECGS